MGQHQGGPLDLLNDLGHSEGLARAGDSQQGLLVQPHLDAAGQGLDGLGLVAAGGVFRYYFKFWHDGHLCLLFRFKMPLAKYESIVEDKEK